MLTLLVALTTLAACTVGRWYLERPSRKDRSYAKGQIELCTCYNPGAGFGLRASRAVVTAASAVTLLSLWLRRRRAPVGVGLLLGGGVSNLFERMRFKKVFDYVCFPKAPGQLRKYVFNLADFAIFEGGLCLLLKKKRRNT